MKSGQPGDESRPIKGMIAIFGSFMFDHRGLTIFSDTNNPLKSDFLFLSDILKEKFAYETIHAQSDLGTFGNTEKILRKHHYDEIHGAESPAIIAMQQHPTIKPWGIFDDDLFRFVVARLKARDRNRPLLQGPDPRARLTELYDARDPLYREVAHITIDTGSQSVASLVTRLLQLLEAHCDSNLSPPHP